MSLIPTLAPSCVSTADAEQVLRSIQYGTASLVVCYGTIRSLLKERDALQREQAAATQQQDDAEMKTAAASASLTVAAEIVTRLTDEIRSVRATLKAVDDETKTLQTALAQCRDAFPIPPKDTELEALWAQAMSCPQSVPDYVQAAAKAKAS
jgi:uncharacterized protein (DUF3084 family)